MIKKIKALIFFQIKVALDNKMDLVYSFFMPLAYLLVNTMSNSHRQISSANQLSDLLPFVGYMVVTGVLNGWVMNTLISRERNFLKTFTSIVGNKLYIFAANFVVNLFSNLLQVLAIVAIYQGITHSINSLVILILLTTAVVMDIIVSLASTIILISRMKLSSIPMILTTYIIVGLALSGLQTNNFLLHILLNMVSMYTLTIDVGSLIYHQGNVSMATVMPVLLPIIVIAIVGLILVKKVPVSSIHVRG
ncbi:hypothetical protein [Fructobacillus tropaeoli]|uniref:Uncharacterized protein n=2 Tax=Fructobacillus tropaeoli TaxID=709323 RepID=A0A3F3GX20_9LACO|nr:hypothetical protein [Fructobacillus tropaeoli]NLS38078.1 hypothetical protein [Fructobacillus tropaeoli]GAP03761.1 hypothetical protein FTRO_0013080 [Fructobacillus tropaeoli]GIC70099.1 hypothetical protein FT12353_07400 [Fructobacillus tropaeoli]CAK1231038.1 hypothetical protein R53137_KAKDMLNK_00353 [Fructobacillus tropaeoli]